MKTLLATLLVTYIQTLLLVSVSSQAVAQTSCPDGILFNGGVSLDGGSSYSPQVNAASQVLVGGTLCPLPAHIGATADLYVAFEIGDTIYFLDNQNELVVYNQTNLSPYRNAVALQEQLPVELFSGVIGFAYEQVYLYVAYVLDDVFHMNPSPIEFSVTALQNLSLAELVPNPQAISVSASEPISISFDRAINPASIASNDIQVFGRWSGALAGNVSLTDDKQTLLFTPDRNLSAGEWVSVTLANNSVEGWDGSVLPGGTSWSYWVETKTAAMAFAKIGVVSAREENAPQQIQTYGAYAGDMNSDGWSDFVVPNELSNDLRVFLNDGSGGYQDFTIIPIDGANKPSPNEGADFDGDGDIDFVVGSAWGSFAHVFLGDGEGGLVQTQNLAVGDRVRGICLADFENDGDSDIVATAYIGNTVALFTNDGSGNFSPSGNFDAGDGEWSCAAGDMNGDGLTDITIGTRNSNQLIVFLSSGNGGFVESDRISAQGDPWMLAAGDVDRNGSVDITAVNANAKTLTVAAGNGQGKLSTPTSYDLSVNGDGFPLAVDLGDLDGDGDLDIVTSDYRTSLFLIHENQGDGSYLRLSNQLTTIGAASCAILHDRDNDGDLDITGIDEISDQLILFSH